MDFAAEQLNFQGKAERSQKFFKEIGCEIKPQEVFFIFPEWFELLKFKKYFT